MEIANDYDSLLLLLKDKTIDLKDAQEYQEQLKRDIGQWEGIVKQRENEILSLQNEYKQSEAVNRQTVSSLEAALNSARDELKARIAEKDILAQQIDLLKAESALIIDSLQQKTEGAMAATGGDSKLKQGLSAGEIKKAPSGADFLNAYYQDPKDLDRERFELHLSKVMVNEGFFFQSE